MCVCSGRVMKSNADKEIYTSNNFKECFLKYPFNVPCILFSEIRFYITLPPVCKSP